MVKKFVLLLLAFSLVGFAVFADEAKVPGVTYGFSGTFDMNVVSANTDDTFESGSYEKPAAKSSPFGLKATNFVVKPWIMMDWEKMSVKADGKYDAYRATADDWSYFTLTSIWKDFFGLEIKSVVSAKNEALANVTTPGVVDLAATTHNVTITLDRLADSGVKLYTIYGANTFFNILDVTAGQDFARIFDGFTEIGFDLDTAGLGAKLVYKGPVAGSDFTTAWIEARKMFDMWTMRVNDSTEMKLRMADLASTVTIARPAFGLGSGLTLVLGNYVNVLNTFSIMDGLTAKAGLSVPTGANVEFADWLAAKNMVVGVQYAVPGVGTIGAGAKVGIDYTKMGHAGGLYEGSSQFFTALGALKPNAVVPGSDIWVDANLSQLVDGLSLFASLDAKFGSYYDEKARVAATPTAAAAYKLSTVGTTVLGIGAEAGMAINDALSVKAAARFGLGSGMDYNKFSNVVWATPVVAADDVGTWGEADWSFVKLGVEATQLKLRADYKLSDVLSLWAANGLTLKAGYFNDGAATPAPGLAIADISDAGGTKAGEVYGFWNKNVITLGAKFVTSANATLSLSTDINMYLGLPTAADLYGTAATAAQKLAIDADYGFWKTKTFSPYAVKAAFAYKY
jgi:hypothetical protein